jgi:hypothetical protein
MKHNLWVDHEEFDKIYKGLMTFKIVVDDREFMVGDTLAMFEYGHDYDDVLNDFARFTGRKCTRVISDIMHGDAMSGLRESWLLISFRGWVK